MVEEEVKSKVWVYFGSYRGAEQKMVKDNQPFCKKLSYKVSEQGANTLQIWSAVTVTSTHNYSTQQV